MNGKRLLNVNYKGRDFLIDEEYASVLLQNTTILEKAFAASEDNGRPVIIDIKSNMLSKMCNTTNSSNVENSEKNSVSYPVKSELGDASKISQVKSAISAPSPVPSKICSETSLKSLRHDWSGLQTVWFINCIKNYIDRLEQATNKQEVWDEITAEFNKEFSIELANKQMYDKWHHLKQRYKDVKTRYTDQTKRRRMAFSYEKEMDDIYKGRHNDLMKNESPETPADSTDCDLSDLSSLSPTSFAAPSLNYDDASQPKMPQMNISKANKATTIKKSVTSATTQGKKGRSKFDSFITFMKQREEEGGYQPKLPASRPRLSDINNLEADEAPAFQSNEAPAIQEHVNSATTPSRKGRISDFDHFMTYLKQRDEQFVGLVGQMVTTSMKTNSLIEKLIEKL